MKLFRIVALCLVMVLSLTTMSFASQPQEKIVTISCSDVNLYNALYAALGEDNIIKHDGTILTVTKQKVDSTTSLNLSNKGIKALDGLENFENMDSLDLSNNQITNLYPLRTMVDLRTLKLGNNEIEDLTTLNFYETENSGEGEEKAGLEYLDLKNNKIKDISELQKFTGMKSLDISGNMVTSVSTLTSLTDLSSLKLSNNKVKSIDELAELESLSTIVADGNRITGVTIPEGVEKRTADLKYFDSLVTLNLKGNLLSDIEFVALLKEGLVADFSNNQIARVPNWLPTVIGNSTASINVTKQNINLDTASKEVNFGEKTSKSNLLYYGKYLVNGDEDAFKITTTNGKLEDAKFTIDDLSKESTITIDNGVFEGSKITLKYIGFIEGQKTPAPSTTEPKEEQATETKTETETPKEEVPTVSVTEEKAEDKKDDSTTASGKMPYTGIASKMALVALVGAIVVVAKCTFSKSKKK